MDILQIKAVENEIDLFDQYGNPDSILPAKLTAILDKYAESDETYENCALMLADCESTGYTFDYYLDAVPTGLHKLPTCFIREDLRDLNIPVGDSYVQFLDEDQRFYYKWLNEGQDGEQFQILTTDQGWQEAASIDFNFD